jgi:uncharacterized protein with HEPN domain
MADKDDNASLWDMLTAARAVVSFAHPDIPWRPIQAQRHVLAHEYGEIKHDRVWRVATVHIPNLIGQLEPLVPNPPQSGSEEQP